MSADSENQVKGEEKTREEEAKEVKVDLNPSAKDEGKMKEEDDDERASKGPSKIKWSRSPMVAKALEEPRQRDCPRCKGQRRW